MDGQMDKRKGTRIDIETGSRIDAETGSRIDTETGSQMDTETGSQMDGIRTEAVDVLIVGGGPAGLAAAVELYHKGIRNILIVEREKQLGGILRQCIHDGFGLTRFCTTLSGPEYAKRFIEAVAGQIGDPYHGLPGEDKGGAGDSGRTSHRGVHGRCCPGIH